MTNPDQVTLDEMARSVVDWMDEVTGIDDSWCLGSKNANENITYFYRGSIEKRGLSQLYTSLDLIREVEEALEAKFGVEWVSENYMKWVRYYSSKSDSYWTTAKDKLRAIYKTLKEAGEV